MASRKEYLQFVLEQLSDLPGITYRAMMGEYILCYGDKVIGGIYDDRLLVKPTGSARAMLPDAPMETTYEGAKEMLLTDVDDRELLARLIPAIADELPPRKKK